MGLARDCLERSCGPLRRDYIRFGARATGLERAEVFLSTWAFERHRHDTYAVGVTLAGVQRFWYRGSQRLCLPGQVHILYPDEVHDGGPATPDGFGYRILYIDPVLLRRAIGADPLPSVADPVQDHGPQVRAITSRLADLDDPLDDLGTVAAAVELADALIRLSGAPRRAGGQTAVRPAARPVARVQEYLAAHAKEPTSSAVLERIAGMDRFAIARHFRRAYGTSPDRYRTMCRVALARAAIQAGRSLVEAAADAGFADQSHMTRHFKRTYGLPPARWAKLTGQHKPAHPTRR